MDECVEKGKRRVRELFGVLCENVDILFSSKGLRFWEAAVTWLDTPPLIQVRPTLLPWYKKEEIIAHELVHLIRAPLCSSKFEELIAYKTANSKLRAWLGPCLEKPWEVYLFFASLLYYPAAALLLSLALCRRLRRSWQWKRACTTITPFLKKGVHPQSVLFHLSDEEITLLAKASKHQFSYVRSCASATLGSDLSRERQRE